MRYVRRAVLPQIKDTSYSFVFNKEHNRYE